jgi:type VI secretion system protein VasD
MSACAQSATDVPGASPQGPGTAAPAPSEAPSQRFAAPEQKFSASPKEQTDLDITITAAVDVNPDDKGRASPILVRLYELRSGAVFDSADYFGLQSNDKAVLAGDLLTRDEFIMRPGEVKTIRRKSHPDLGAIAVLAGYRDLANSEWHAVLPITPAPETAWYRFVVPAKKSQLQVQFQAKSVRIEPTH